MNALVAKGKAVAAALSLRKNTAIEPAAGDNGQSVLKASAAFMRNNVSPILARWVPALRDTQDDVRQSWSLATARAIDVIQNSGWIAGGIRTACGNVLGDGLRLVAKPDTTLIKFEGLLDDRGGPIDAEGWARFVERRWEAWSGDPAECDAVGRQTVDQMAEAQFKAWFATGEITATLPYHRDSYAITGTKVLNIPAYKLSQKNDPMNRIVQGVQMDERGRPYAYLFRWRDRLGIEQETPILARDAAGRPQVIHVYEAMPGQVRGITPMVPALQVTRQYDQLANATLTAALIQTIFAATIESDAPTLDLLNALQTDSQQGIGGNLEDFLAARMGWHQSTSIDLSDQSKIAHLFPGEKLKFNRSEHPNTTYKEFVRMLLLEIAKCLGITYEQLTGDYTGVTYTGVRMSSSDMWPVTKSRRKHLAARFYQPIYEAWLEEEIESGRIKFPGGFAGFMRYRSAACRAHWRGPAKPQADDLKAAKTHEIYRKLGLMSDTMIADDLGVTITSIYEERQREAQLRERFGLSEVGHGGGTPGLDAPDAHDDDPDTPSGAPTDEREAA